MVLQFVAEVNVLTKEDGTYSVPPLFPDANGVLLKALMLLSSGTDEQRRINVLSFEQLENSDVCTRATLPRSHFCKLEHP